MLDILSYISGFVYGLGEVSVQVFCPFLNWIFCFPGVESCEFFIYFGDQILVHSNIEKYFSPYDSVPFQFDEAFFSCAENQIKT